MGDSTDGPTPEGTKVPERNMCQEKEKEDESWRRMTSVRELEEVSQLSKIRKKGSCPATTTTVVYSRSGDPTRILKRGGLESSGQVLISSSRKTKSMAYFLVKLLAYKFFLRIFQNFWVKK